MSSSGFRHLYGPSGPDGYYLEHGDDYRNPHEPAVVACVEFALRHWGSQIDFSRALDLAAGSGEVSLALLRLLPDIFVEGIDPYTHRLYERRTARPCRPVSFEQLARGDYVLPEYGCIVCSCALHLVGESWLPAVCLALAGSAPDLLVLTPLTRPEIRSAWGWNLVEQTTRTVDDRTLRLRWYRRISPPPATS